ncbi:hypothetical protein CLAIMM_11560 isoform 1 [Cladophialophora immunda]|nr:hypothetical protein CLAIMM_11560 isoform 1 [Cladophialophora immunda]
MSIGVPKRVYDAVVVGAGGAGVATVGALLHYHQGFRIGWVDPDFSGGRISKRYRDVSSNTKTSLFRQYADAFEPFRQIVASTPKPNAVTVLEALEQNRGCRLRYAADMLTMLTSGLRKHPNVEIHVGDMSAADFQTSSAAWSMCLDPSDQAPDRKIYARNVIMCTGSSPTKIPLPCSTPTVLDLDDVLDRQKLRSSLPSADESLVVGVIGTSHSAIVAIMNLYELATGGTHPRLQVKWFVRGPMTYAVEMDGWILRDNTGLKGASADFARAHLEDDKLRESPVGKVLTKVDCPDVRDASMTPHLDSCTHVVEAIGYTRDPLPRLSVDGTTLEGITHDPTKGLLLDGNGHAVPHAYGAGIAFPERVTDPAGNTESAVGLWKFIKYLHRVAPTWC